MRRLALLVAVLAALFAVSLAKADPGRQVIYVTNHSSLDGAKFADALPAFQQAISEDFAPYWSDAQLVYLGDRDAPKGSWRIVLTDTPDCFFCAGYHEVRNGAPYAVVGVDAGWTVTFTHELFEVLGNPWIDRGVLVGRRWWAMETADPVESDSLSYTRRSLSGENVAISDFVFPNWFRKGSVGPWDFVHAAKRARQLLPDGYQLFWGPSGWDAIYGALVDGWTWTGPE